MDFRFFRGFRGFYLLKPRATYTTFTFLRHVLFIESCGDNAGRTFMLKNAYQ